MIAFLEQYSPIVQALFGTLFTWGMTAIGAGMIFLTKQVSRKLLDGMLGFASGVMIAASYWSLLAPAIEMSEGAGCAFLGASHRWFPDWWGLPVCGR